MRLNALRRMPRYLGRIASAGTQSRATCCFAWAAAAAQLVAWASGLAAEKNTEIIADSAYLHPQRLVAIADGRRLNLYCVGTGSPTVVFDSGRGDDMSVWGLVQPSISAVSRACSYDRAGLGFSDASPQLRTSANMVEDLRRLLHGAHLRPPFVLVGHSMGGLNIKLFAELHPSEVAGLVFVDPAHEDIAKRGFELDPEAGRQYSLYLDRLHDCLTSKPSDFIPGSSLYHTCASRPPNSGRYSDAINVLERQRSTRHEHLFAWISEQANAAYLSSDQVRAAHRDLGDIPLIVVYRQDSRNQIGAELNADTAKMSTRGSIRVVENSSHYIQLDQPREVINAVLDVWHMTQAAALKR